MIQIGMTKDQVNRFNISGRGQHLCRKRAPAIMGRTLLDTSLAVGPGDGLLQGITGPLCNSRCLNASSKACPLCVMTSLELGRKTR